MTSAIIIGLSALLGVIAFGVLFRVPRSYLLAAGIAGMVASTLYSGLLSLGISRVGASFVGAAALSGIAEWGARRLRVPVTLLVVPGLIPLVPGADAYFAMLAFLQGRPEDGVEITVQTLLVALSVAAGIVAVATIWRGRSGATRCD